MANPAPTINQINAFNATQGTTIDFNIIGGTELVRSNRIYIYDLSDNSLICTHLYVSTESIHELPPNTDGSIVYESGKSSADFVNGAQYYAQIQTFTDIAGTQGGSGLSVSKLFWCLVDPSLTIDTIPSSISTTSYNVSATYNANTSVVSNIIQQYQFSLYSATGSLLQSSGVVVGSGTQQGTSTAYDISYNFTGLSVGRSYYVVVDVTTTQGMSVSVQSNTFTVSIDTPTLGEATVVNNACDGYISVTSNLSSEYGGSGSGDIVSFETDSENVFTKLQVTFSPTQSGTGTPSPSNVRPIYGVGGVDVDRVGKNLLDADNIIWTDGLRDDDGNIVASSSHFTNAIVGIKPNTQYTISGTLMTTGSYRIYFLTKNEEWIERTATRTVVPLTFETPNNCGAIQIQVTTTVTNLDDVQLEEGTTATAYEPYQGQTISQEFDVSLTPTSKDTDPYLFKAVGDIYGDRLEEELVGGTVCWNQLVQNGDFSNGTANWVKYSASNPTTSWSANDGVLTHTITGGTTTHAYYYSIYQNGVIRDATHKHLVVIVVEPSVATTFRIEMGGGTKYTTPYTLEANKKTTVSCIVDAFTANKQLLFEPYSAVNQVSAPSMTMKYYSANVIDLTAFFGNATIADAIYAMEQAETGSGVAFMRKYFPKLFTAEYDAGTIKSVNPTAHVTRGVNAWDEEWELGTINTNTGVNIAYSGCIRSKNYIKVLPNTTYYIQYPNISGSALLYYDEDENFISAYGIATAREFTTPSNCGYVRFKLGDAYGTTYNNDICINISNSEINGQYFPYEEHTYDLGNVPLYGVFQLENGKLKAYGDVRHAVGGTDRKFMLVDLGTLTWIYDGDEIFRAHDTRMKFMGNGICTKYTWVQVASWSQVGEGEMSVTNSAQSPILRVHDSTAGTDATAFKSAMSGVYLVCEKATTTTEQTDSFEQIQEVSKYGTLEYITTNNVPVGHNTTYYTRDIFGGYIDLVSGELVVDIRYVQAQDLRWGQSPTVITRFYTGLSGGNRGNVNERNKTICSHYDTASWSGATSYGIFLNTGGQILVNQQTINTLENWNSFLTEQANEGTPVTICYPLETPLTYQLTPQQIQTLIGQNNVWSEQGDIELAYHIPITNLLVKRQDVDDVSGNWLTLYSQPITQASDMDFTFIDFLNQYGKTYKYALVPLLTQTQSGVEVEVEGGYTVSDEVQSIFDGVFISDSTGSQKCKANVGYGNVNMNQSVGSITPIGSQYPIIVTNSNNRYHNGSISGMIVPDDYYYNGNLSRIDMVNKRNELEQFLTNKRAKIIKDWNSNIWLVMIMDDIDCSFDNNYGMGIVTFNANWLEIGDPTNQEDLQATGLVDVGGV